MFLPKRGGRKLKLKRFFKKEKGQAMVEFALVLPILLLYIGGVIDFRWIFHNQLAANNASREAARYIAIHYYFDSMNTTTATTKASEIINDYVKLVDLAVDNIIPEDDDVNDGKKVKVKLSGKVIILTPILRAILDNDGDGKFPIQAETTMRVEK
ncbi:pilus assembly protein [Sedimentibacter sp.]|uniref:TadE/TadG family type IV pilus assembly protein n=1 Tax=Sedimentibacter sp. TaxID=1960295 RepID=UPI0028AD51EE|nr:pilus assembly protein [Sedimentibacter sp.]